MMLEEDHHHRSRKNLRELSASCCKSVIIIWKCHSVNKGLRMLEGRIRDCGLCVVLLLSLSLLIDLVIGLYWSDVGSLFINKHCDDDWHHG
jgi:uncharacterized protein YacL